MLAVNSVVNDVHQLWIAHDRLFVFLDQLLVGFYFTLWHALAPPDNV
jgi:hypothetical protein